MPAFMEMGVLSNKVVLADADKSADLIIPFLKDNKDCGVFLLPPYCLGGNVGDLALSESFIEKTRKAFLKLSEATESVLIMGSYGIDGKISYFVFSKGEKTETLNIGNYLIFYLNGLKTCLYLKGIGELLFDLQDLKDVELLLVCDQTPAVAGNDETLKKILSVTSSALGCKLIYLNGGAGDTSAPNLYKGIVADYSFGDEIFFNDNIFESIFYKSTIDEKIIKGYKRTHKLPLFFRDGAVKFEVETCSDSDIDVFKDPFLAFKSDGFLDEIFNLQASSLAVRLRNTKIKKLVIGVSGGLDSTLALLVCKKATEILSLPSENIVAVTMKGFGTSGRTYENAMALMRALGCTIKEISIKDSVMLHFSDIGKDSEIHDVTYENAQARERTQILLDVANMVGGIVVGTGDLSESALGFCTFAGDHISNYNVNICITKTMMRKIVSYLSDTDVFECCGDILKDILDTPISPELLPSDDAGNIAQKTEGILGPYELHDFFLYYLIRYGLSGEDIEFYAKKAFKDINEEEIKRCLSVFLKRFIFSRFKRACAPESADITEINLSKGNFEFPSDCNNIF